MVCVANSAHSNASRMATESTSCQLYSCAETAGRKADDGLCCGHRAQQRESRGAATESTSCQLYSCTETAGRKADDDLCCGHRAQQRESRGD